jgi:GH15 family glucan-1,4-alpha-glucosidase
MASPGKWDVPPDLAPATRRFIVEVADAAGRRCDPANAFAQSFGSDELDASGLMLPLVGFLPADDARVLSTIAATEERLTDDRGLVYRYRTHDGLEGEEGTFLLCTFWLAQALARAGQPARARTVFERAAAFVNDVGLLAEEVDPVSGELLGNFPQAFSHIGLVNAAWAIAEVELAQKATAGDAPGDDVPDGASGGGVPVG